MYDDLKKASSEIYNIFAYINLSIGLDTFNLDKYDLDKIKSLMEFIDKEVKKGRAEESIKRGNDIEPPYRGYGSVKNQIKA